MNNINWNKYVDYIYCINYLSNNRLHKISKTLQNIGIDIYDNRFFSFIFDIDKNIFKNDLENIKNKSFNKLYELSLYRKFYKDYIFHNGLRIYYMLKIAQYMNYERIIMFEDDIVFHKNKEYIINALDYLNTTQFDIAICQTTFVECCEGKKDDLIHYLGYKEENNGMFLRTNNACGVWGGSFNILSKRGINKIINFFETYNVVTGSDDMYNFPNVCNLDVLLILEPLCIQEHMLNWDINTIMNQNINIKLENYVNI